MAGKPDVVILRFFARRFCTALVAARVITAARRPKHSTRTVTASVFSLFPTASQIALMASSAPLAMPPWISCTIGQKRYPAAQHLLLMSLQIGSVRIALAPLGYCMPCFEALLSSCLLHYSQWFVGCRSLHDLVQRFLRTLHLSNRMQSRCCQTCPCSRPWKAYVLLDLTTLAPTGAGPT